MQSYQENLLIIACHRHYQRMLLGLFQPLFRLLMLHLSFCFCYYKNNNINIIGTNIYIFFLFPNYARPNSNANEKQA